MQALQSSALRVTLAAALPVGLVLSAAVVWQSTSAAFTASTDNPGNSWQSGTVALSDSDGNTIGSALFDSDRDGVLAPLQSDVRCIRVDYTGSLPADIRFYVTTPDDGSDTLDPYLVMSVEEGLSVPEDTEVAPDCSTGFTAKTTPTSVFPIAPADDPTLQGLRTHSGYQSGGIPVGGPDGSPVGTPTQPGTHLTFKITYMLEDDNDAQGKRSDARFVWEARNA
jgi:hypothetical protein